MKLPSLALRPHFWTALFVIWFAVLWYLSGRPGLGPKIAFTYHLDKVYHFGYFFGGAGLLTAAIFLQKRRILHWSTIHLLVVLILAAVGSLDEYHQSWYEFRSGNDSADMTADIFGALAGSLMFRALQPKLFPKRF